jgi:hypothetical protein
VLGGVRNRETVNGKNLTLTLITISSPTAKTATTDAESL